MSVYETKKVLRAEMRDRRQTQSGNAAFLAEKLKDIFIANIPLDKNLVVSSYKAMRDEMDTSVLVDTLRQQGHRIALPVIIEKRAPLIFRLYEPGDRLIADKMGILEPAPEAKAIDPDILLIPLLAFDRKRNRLGYGGGYYDRTLKGLRACKQILAVGIAYAFQEVDEVPTGPNDIGLDKIVTEVEAI